MLAREHTAQAIAAVRAAGRTYVLEPEVKAILGSYGIDITREMLCSTVLEAQEAASKIGYPVVMKLVSADLVHKSDIGGVSLGIGDPSHLQHAYADMVGAFSRALPHSPPARISVQETVSGQEMIIGAVADEQFGPLMMVGTGGVSVELFKDVTYRLAPLEHREARRAVDELKGAPLLGGYRGRPGANIECFCDTIVRVSLLVAEQPAIKELDLNPVFVGPKRVVVADARAFVE